MKKVYRTNFFARMFFLAITVFLFLCFFNGKSDINSLSDIGAFLFSSTVLLLLISSYVETNENGININVFMNLPFFSISIDWEDVHDLYLGEWPFQILVFYSRKHHCQTRFMLNLFGGKLIKDLRKIINEREIIKQEKASPHKDDETRYPRK